jgi:hypothetical protein
MKPTIIAVAITGSVPRKKDNPALPVSVAEQIESTHAAFEAGAALVHVHVRNPDESPSSDPALFQQVLDGVRRHCPGMIVQFSTGGRGRDQNARGAALYQRPDMASLATGSVNFPSIIYENPPALVDELATRMKEFHVLPEIEIFDLSHIYAARRLAARAVRARHQECAAGRRTRDRHPARRTQTGAAERNLDRCRHRAYPDAGDQVGAGARRRRGAHGNGRQHPRQPRSPGRGQRGAGPHRGGPVRQAWHAPGKSAGSPAPAWPAAVGQSPARVASPSPSLFQSADYPELDGKAGSAHGEKNRLSPAKEVVMHASIAFCIPVILLAACGTAQERAAYREDPAQAMAQQYGPGCEQLGHVRDSPQWRNCILRSSSRQDLAQYANFYDRYMQWYWIRQ